MSHWLSMRHHPMQFGNQRGDALIPGTDAQAHHAAHHRGHFHADVPTAIVQAQHIGNTIEAAFYAGKAVVYVPAALSRREKDDVNQRLQS